MRSTVRQRASQYGRRSYAKEGAASAARRASDCAQAGRGGDRGLRDSGTPTTDANARVRRRAKGEAVMPNGVSKVSLGDQVTAEEGLPVPSTGSVSSLLGQEAEGQDVNLEGGPGGQGYTGDEHALVPS